jgi:hypothetical protein
MLLNRDYVGYMATEVIKKLVDGGLIETKAAEAVALRLRQRMNEELSVEDRVNEQARQILTEHQEEMRRTNVSYQDMFKKVKAQLARDGKLILR